MTTTSIGLGLLCLLTIASSLQIAPGIAASRAATRGSRAPAPRSSLAPMANALHATAASQVSLPTASLLADDVFGEVFMAGMSIAFAAVGVTIFVGILVRGKYDDIEKSFFEAQDEQLAEERTKEAPPSQAVSDFFGDVNPTEARPSSESSSN